MILRFLLALVLVLLPCTLRAGDLGPSQTIPPNGVLRGQFVQDHYFKNSDKPLRSQGRFMVAPKHGILWIIEKPLPMTLAFTSKGMTQSIGNIPLLQVSTARVPLLSRLTTLINSMMSSQWDALETDFTISHTPTDKGWRTTLKPKAEKSGLPFRALTLSGDTFIESARAMRLDEGLEVFTFSNQTTSPSPPTTNEMTVLTAGTTKPLMK